MWAAERTTTSIRDNPFFRVAVNPASIDRYGISFADAVNLAWTIAHVVSKSPHATEVQKVNAREVLDRLRPTHTYLKSLLKPDDAEVAKIPPSHRDYQSVQGLLRCFSEFKGKTAEVIQERARQEAAADTLAENRRMAALERYLIDRTAPPSRVNMWRPTAGVIQVLDIVSLLTLPTGAFFSPDQSVSDPSNAASLFLRSLEATGQGRRLKGGVASSQRGCTDVKSIGIVLLERADRGSLGLEDLRQVLDATDLVVPSSRCISQDPRAISSAYQHFHPIDRLNRLLSEDVPLGEGSKVTCTLRASLPAAPASPHCAALLLTAAKEGPGQAEYLCLEGVVLGIQDLPAAAQSLSVEPTPSPAEKKSDRKGGKPRRVKGKPDGQRA